MPSRGDAREGNAEDTTPATTAAREGLSKALPRIPEDEAVRRLLLACPDTFEGRRARALITLLADSGLRVSEALRLRIEDVRFATRTLVVRSGKGGKDRTGFFGAAAAQELRAWAQTRTDAHPEDFLFTDRRRSRRCARNSSPPAG